MDHVSLTLTNGTAHEVAPLFPEITHAKKRAMLAALAHCLSVTAACAQTGIARQTHYEWAHEDPAYGAALAHAKQLGAEWLEDIAITRATREHNPSDTLLIFLLKGAMPQKYKDSPQTQVNVDRPVEVVIRREG